MRAVRAVLNNVLINIPVVSLDFRIQPTTPFVDTRPETTKLLMFLLRISARVCP
ncbi:hypothetical protein PBCV1_A690fR [Paramecium bursaria Chlorella virus 1]|uniref:Uncharacterized protein n=1 Tax=Paramecium bursaria Chlorella virus 1 TaxID=10506 RepID=F8TU94_PBCV1|nr:hypothetical protein PBCV1_A002bL [Paramecium bursaria Chlorella virus 1]YP_004679010.1 hypothetical protein PBCV1_A690fR [Paramecium bursaria Chlorella virus 1]AEI70016.1 hypothetical protein [Paramecium bursaria Chlorella virus 1]AEI70155.1 hypothetical protein [Paramecium bursaria Chlorella virus 1]